MKLIKYCDPFQLDRIENWKELSNYPHFCVSNTLEQGLSFYYKQTSFGLIRTIESLMNRVFQTWLTDRDLQVKQYIALSKEISRIENSKLRSAYKHNQGDVLKSIRLLIEAGIPPTSVPSNGAVMERFRDIYQALWNVDVFKVLNNLNITKDHIEDALGDLVHEQVNAFLDSQIDWDKKKNSGDIETRLNLFIEYLSQKGLHQTGDIDDKINNALKQAQNLIEVIHKTTQSKKLIFHGVHQFTPLLLRLIDSLNVQGYELILLINYNEDFQKIYSTWDRVYQYLEFEEELYCKCNVLETRDLGRCIGYTMEGKTEKLDKDQVVNLKKHTFKKYDYITSYANEISTEYKIGLEKANKKGMTTSSSILAQMEVAYYGVNSTRINEILRVIFPEQFKERHFLAYPVGQFILSLYDSWDDSSNQLLITQNIKSIMSFDIWSYDPSISIAHVYDCIASIFEKEQTFREGIKQLERLLAKIKSYNDTAILRDSEIFVKTRVFSHLNVSEFELIQLISVLEEIDAFANSIFISKSGQINFKDHLSQLIEAVKVRAHDDVISDDERTLVNELSKRLDMMDATELEGTIQDIKSALHLYLNVEFIKEENSSNWIMRNLEQLDGGVLLSKVSDKTIHIGFLSEQDLSSKTGNNLPWPLSINVLNEFGDATKYFSIYKTSMLEYGNFLRYAMFYGIYYNRSEVELSYVENIEEEKMERFYVYEILGLDFNEVSIISADVRDHEPLVRRTFRPSDDKDNNMKDLIVCRMKYYLNHLSRDNFIYTNEFQKKILYRTIGVERIMEHVRKFDQRLFQRETLKDIFDNHVKRKVDSTMMKLESYFPHWSISEKRDLRGQIEENLLASFKFYYNCVMKNKLDLYQRTNQRFIENRIRYLFNEMEEVDLRQFREMYVLKKNGLEFGLNEIKTNDEICRRCNYSDMCLLNKICE